MNSYVSIFQEVIKNRFKSYNWKVGNKLDK